MNEKERLYDLIQNAQKPTIIEWVYEVEAFLKVINEFNSEALLDAVKILLLFSNKFFNANTI